MPQPFNGAVLTDAGAKLITQAQSGGAAIEFTRMAVGSGKYSSAEKAVTALQKAKGLKAQKNTYAPSRIYADGEHCVKVTALITNFDPVGQTPLVSEGYHVNEVGLFARPRGGGQEVLYSIAVVTGEEGDFMPPYNGHNPAQITQDFFVTVDNSATVTVDTAGAALLAADANTVTDDSTQKKYKLGIDNGLLYWQEVGE